MNRTKRNVLLLASSLGLLLLWQVIAKSVNIPVLMPALGPIFTALRSLTNGPTFSTNILSTVLRALRSFVIIVISGSILGLIGGRNKTISLILKPFVTTLKATPVMSVILLAFIWFSSSSVPLFSAFMMGFPLMYLQIEHGVNQLDPTLAEMCDLYDVPPKTKLFYYTLPSLAPWFVAGSRATLSMIWKVVIAAEVLTVPRYGVGSRLQLAQVQLQTDVVLSWTLVAILLTALGDLLFEGIVHAVVIVRSTVQRRRADALQKSI